jgi:hypothetical protein
MGKFLMVAAIVAGSVLVVEMALRFIPGVNTIENPIAQTAIRVGVIGLGAATAIHYFA